MMSDSNSAPTRSTRVPPCFEFRALGMLTMTAGSTRSSCANVRTATASSVSRRTRLPVVATATMYSSSYSAPTHQASSPLSILRGLVESAQPGFRGPPSSRPFSTGSASVWIPRPMSGRPSSGTARNTPRAKTPSQALRRNWRANMRRRRTSEPRSPSTVGFRPFDIRTQVECHRRPRKRRPRAATSPAKRVSSNLIIRR